MVARLIRPLAVAAVVAGVALRCDGLGRRPLWYDEAATVLHLSGRSEEALQASYDGRPLRRVDVLGAPASVAAVVAAARQDEPQSGPAYFALAAVWQQLGGRSLGGLRALSAVASGVAIAAAWLLARRLFGDPEVALAIAALVALSPLHVRYAQEARPYALWSAALLVWMLASLRAETGGRSAWVGPGTALLAALLVHPLTLLALPAVAALAPGRPFRVASGIAVSVWTILSLPAWSNGAAMGRTTAWVGEPATVTGLVRAWLGALTSVFFRPGGEGGVLGGSAASFTGGIVWLLLGVAAAVLVTAALTVLGGAPARARAFVRRLVVAPWALLAVVDLVGGGRRSAVARYLVPAWLGAELAVGRFLAAPALGRTRLRRALLVGVVGLAAVTALRTRGAALWWDTDPGRMRELAAIAAAVRARPGAVVLGDLAPTALVELAHALDDEVVLRLGPTAPMAVRPDEWDRVLVVRASDDLLVAVRRAAGPARTLAPLADVPATYAVVSARR